MREMLLAWDWEGGGLPRCRVCASDVFDFLGDKHAALRATDDEVIGWYGDWVAVDDGLYCPDCLRWEMPIRPAALPARVELP